MYQCGILQLLIDVSLTSNAPQRVKASAFYALAELIRLNKVNQDALSKAVIIPAQPPVFIPEAHNAALTPPSRSSAQLSRSSFQSGRNSALGDHRPFEQRERCPAIVEVVAIAVGKYPGCTYSVRAAATCLFQVRVAIFSLVVRIIQSFFWTCRGELALTHVLSIVDVCTGEP